MAARFSDSLGKRAVRELWNTPLLTYLHGSYDVRYRYMGLPGVDLLDVRLWKDMIDEVVAFEVRARPNNNDPQGRRSITALRRNLRLLGIRGHAYFGPMEEVVILREDYDGTEYRQEQVVTLYNLDFCDEIGSRIATRREGRQVWRFEAIRQILRDQRECYRRVGGPSLFVMLLTIRDQIDAGRLRGFLAKDLYHDTQEYVEACNGQTPLPASGYVLGTHTWALKAFLHGIIRQYLSNPHISALFFPVVKYTGVPVRSRRGVLPSPMLHCMILCRFDDPQSPCPSFLPADYLRAATSVRAREDHTLVWEAEPGEPLAVQTNPASQDWLRPLEPLFLRGVGGTQLRAAQLRGLTQAELKEIQQSLAELGGVEP